MRKLPAKDAERETVFLLLGLSRARYLSASVPKDIESCADCSDFPCDNLQPYADHASEFPHNMKVFNLALIRKMGVEKWTQEKAKLVMDNYFGGKFNI